MNENKNLINEISKMFFSIGFIVLFFNGSDELFAILLKSHVFPISIVFVIFVLYLVLYFTCLFHVADNYKEGI